MTLRRATVGLMLAAALWAMPVAAQPPATAARQLIAAGGRAMAQGQPDEALKAYEAALGLAVSDDERAQALFGMANVHRSRRDVVRQLDYLRQAEALPQAGAAYVQAARRQLVALYREQRDFAAARQMSEKLLAAARGPDERLALTLELAQLDVREGKFAEAAGRLQPLLKEQLNAPVWPEVYSTLIMALIGANCVPEAVALAREALQRFPDRPDLVLGTARELSDRGKLDEATGLLQDALLARPAQEDMLRGLYEIVQQRDQLGRLTDWIEKQARGAGQAVWLGHLARVHEWAGQLPQALEAYQRLLALGPTNAEVLQRAAQLALRANDTTRAEAWLRQAVAAQPDDEALATLLGEALLKQAKLQPALEVWRRGLGYKPDDPQSVRRLGSVLMRYELYEAALDVYREGRRAAGEREAFAVNMANAHEKLGQLPEAAREYAVALASPGRAPVAGLAVSELYRLADDDAARSAVAAAVTELRQQGGLPTEGLGVLLYAQTLQGEDTRKLLDEMLAAEPGGDTAREAASAALRAASRLETRGKPELALGIYARLMQGASGAMLGSALARRVADLQMRTGDWRAALTTLKQAVTGDTAPALSPGQRAELAAKLGDALLRQARRPTDAIGAFELAVKAAPETATARLAQWGQADALFALGECEQALGEYARLLKLPAVEDRGEFGMPGLPTQVTLPREDYVAFQTAEALLRQGQYAKAGEAFHKLAAADATSAYANDALERVLLINRLQQDKAGAAAYMGAVKAWAQGEADTALRALAPVVDEKTAPGSLRDVGLMLLAQIRVWQGDVAAAVATYDRLSTECPESPLGPQAAFTAAMLLSATDRPAAQGRLQALVTKFPEATEAEEAQLVLRAWQGK